MAASSWPVPPRLIKAALTVVVIWGFAQSGPFLIPLCVSALLAFLMAPLLRWLRRRRVPEWLALTLCALALALPILGFVVAVIAQAQSLAHDFPKIVRALDETLARFAGTKLGRGLSPGAGIGVSLERGFSVVLSGVLAVLGATTSILLVVLFAVLMLAARDRLAAAGERALPRGIVIQATRLVERFLIARFLIALVIGAVDLGVLVSFGVNYAFLLATFLGFMTIVPAIGFLLSAAPPVLVAFATGHSLVRVLGMLACLIVMNIVEGNILTPRLVGRTLNLNVLTSFLGIFAGGLLWGVPGMLLSLPLLAVARVAMLAFPTLEPWAELLSEPGTVENRKVA